MQRVESQSWAGCLAQIHHGPAAIAHEPLVPVTVKFPQPMLEAIDKRSKNRSITSGKPLQPPSKYELQPIPYLKHFYTFLDKKNPGFPGSFCWRCEQKFILPTVALKDLGKPKKRF